MHVKEENKAVQERVAFCAPCTVRCTSCGVRTSEGTALNDVAKQCEDGHVLYTFLCSTCGVLCAFRRKAGSRHYALHLGLSLFDELGAEQRDKDTLELTAAMRTRARNRATTAASALALAPDPELETLLQAREHQATLATKAACVDKMRKPSKQRRRRRTSGDRARARCLRAALGDEQAQTVRHAARKLRRNGVQLGALLGRVEKSRAHTSSDARVQST